MAGLDLEVLLFLHRALAGWITPLAVLSAIGGGWGALAVIPMLAWARTRLLGRSLAIVLAATAVFVFALKQVVARTRPCNCVPSIHALVWGAPTDYSFPSGHAAGSFAFTMFLAIVLVRTARTPRDLVLRWGLAVLLFSTAVGVGLSRIALGVHFPGDVVAGAIFGSTFAALGARAHMRELSRRTCA